LAAARAAVKRVVKLLAMRAAMLLLLGDVALEGWVGDGGWSRGKMRSGRSGSIFLFVSFLLTKLFFLFFCLRPG
jgi:hypothetical protein